MNISLLTGATSMEQLKTLIPIAYKFGDIEYDIFVECAVEKGRTFDDGYNPDDVKSILGAVDKKPPDDGGINSPYPQLDLSKASPCIFTSPPPARDYVIEGLMVAGKSYVNAGFGGVSKTMLAIQAATSVASDTDFFGHESPLGSVMLLLGEENMDEVNRRLNAHWTHLNMPTGKRQEIAKRIAAFGLVGEDIRLTKLIGGNAEQTGFAVHIVDAAVEHQKNCGLPIRLIVIDHARLASGGDMNDAAHATAAMREVNYIAQATGAAVLVIAHSPKAAAQSETASAMDVAGSTALVDNARGAFVLTKLSKAEAKKRNIKEDAANDLVLFTVVKNNYGPTGEAILLCRKTVPGYQMSVLDIPEMVSRITPLKARKPLLRDNLLAKAKEVSGSLSKTKFIDQCHRASKESRREVENAIEALLDEGLIEVRAPSMAEKDQWALIGNVREVLAVCK